MYLYEAIRQAIALIVSLDPELLQIASVSIMVSSSAILISVCFGVPLGLFISFNKFPFKKAVLTVLNTLMALPTVVVGLLVYGFISRKGFFGNYGLLFTPIAMIIGQVILACPIVTALIVSGLNIRDIRIESTALSLGAGPIRAKLCVLKETKYVIMAAIIAGFGRIFAEVGVSMMLGGNIRFFTRNITTAIAFQTMRGEFSLALALGFILLGVSCIINILLQMLTREKTLVK